MSLNAEDLRQHCETILKSKRIKNKIVVLCEGNIESFAGRRSPQLYKQMEKMPDANFYKACIPKWWGRFQEPRFFNCHDRQGVLNSYSLLLRLHREDSRNSFLNPEKLFAIVDLDIQSQAIADYPFADTEAIFHDLYREGKVNETNAAHHRIWVTGLAHKEAYFISPEVKPFFEDPKVKQELNYYNTESIYKGYNPEPIYKGSPVLLDKIYLDMAESINKDKDLKNHLYVVSQRIRYCPGLDCTSRSKLQDSWKSQFDKAEGLQRRILIMALLTVIKAKAYWQQIEPSGDWNFSDRLFREQLYLKIAEFYSRQERDSKYHLPVLFKTLFKAR